MGFILINFKVLTIVENTKLIALNFEDKIKPHKLDEHRFHFWETFSSPIATLFASTIGGLFFLILNRVFLKFDFEPVAFWGFLPTFLVVVLNGAALGALIWHAENSIHYIWHCFAIREGFKLPTPSEFYVPIREAYQEPARKVRQALIDIFGIYVPIGQIGLSLLLNHPIYEAIILALIYALLFPRIINFAFKKMVPLPD